MPAPTVLARDIVIATGVISRRKLRRHPQRVHVDDGRVFDMDAQIEIPAEGLRCRVRGQHFRVTLAPAPLWRMHKPTGVVTSRRNDGAPSIFTLVPDAIVDDVEPVGRLDVDTSGLLLFTGDGTLQHRLTHPKRAVPRVYRATLASPLAEDRAQALRTGGVTLKDGVVPSVEALEPASDDRRTWSVTLTSGKYHEVRRLFAACGAPVETLHRVSYGPMRADDLEPGDMVPLTPDERAAVYSAVSLEEPEPALSVVPVDA